MARVIASLALSGVFLIFISILDRLAPSREIVVLVLELEHEIAILHVIHDTLYQLDLGVK
jgi:hypothetical protein